MSRKSIKEAASVDPGFGSFGPWAQSANGPPSTDDKSSGRGFSFAKRKSKNSVQARRRLGDDWEDYEDEEEEDEDDLKLATKVPLKGARLYRESLVDIFRGIV